MRVAYAIQSHQNPQQLERLVMTLLRWDPHCFVHVSHDVAGSDLPARMQAHERVHVSYDVGGRGRFHNVARWLNAATWLQQHEEVDFMLNLTGQDYPVLPVEQVHTALARSGDGSMEYFHVLSPESPWPTREGRTRYMYAWHDTIPITAGTKRRLHPLHALNRLQPGVRINVAYDRVRLGIRHRGTPDGLELFGGSFFVNLSWRSVERVLRAMETRPDIRRWAERSLLIEEAFFQTILLSCGGLVYANSSKRFYDFSASKMGSPAMLGPDDVPRALESGAFFARKFDESHTPGVLDLIDTVIAPR